MTSPVQFVLELLQLTLRWEIPSEKQPENSLWEWLLTAGGSWRLISDLVEVLVSVGDAVDWVQLGCLIDHSHHASHTSDDLAHSDFSELGLIVLLLEGVEHLLLLDNLGLELWSNH